MFTYRRRAYYHETDQMGLIHHSNYLKWMEEGRIAFMDEMGLSYKEMEETGILSPVVEVSVQYRQPVAFDDEVEIRISVEKYTGAVLEVAYDIFNVTKNKQSAQAQSKHCFLKDGRPVSLKRALPEADAKIRSLMEGGEE